MPRFLLLIEWALLPKYFDWANVLYLVLHLGLPALAFVHYRARVTAHKRLLGRLAHGMAPGDLDKMQDSLRDVRGARMLLIAIVVWEVGGSVLLFLSGRHHKFW